MNDHTQIQPGWDIYSREGEHLGKVSDVTDSYVTLEKGILSPTDYFVPASAIRDVRPEQGQVFVDAAKGQIDQMGWDQPPEDDVDGDYVANANQSTNGTWDATEAGRQPVRPNTAAGPFQGAGTGSGQGFDTGETRRIPRYEETLRAEKRSQQAGEVRVSKDLDEEQQSFDVTVTREDVEVRRVAADSPANGTEEAFREGDTIRVPVRAEQVDVTREPRVVEEVEIRKTAHRDRQRVSDTVRRERVNVEGTGNVDIDDQGNAATSGGDVDAYDRNRMRGQDAYDAADTDDDAGPAKPL